MQAPKTWCTTALIAAAILCLTVPAWAGNGKGSGNGSGTRTQSRLKDGSCTKAVEVQDEAKLLVKGSGNFIYDMMRDQVKDQLRDGSCADDAEA